MDKIGFDETQFNLFEISNVSQCFLYSSEVSINIARINLMSPEDIEGVSKSFITDLSSFVSNRRGYSIQINIFQ